MQDDKNEAVRALINIAVLEVFILVGVVGLYLYTNRLSLLVGGLVASMLIFGPVVLRWYKVHGGALAARRASDADCDRDL